MTQPFFIDNLDTEITKTTKIPIQAFTYNQLLHNTINNRPGHYIWVIARTCTITCANQEKGGLGRQ